MSRLHQPRAGFWIRFFVSILYPFDEVAFRIRWRHLDRMPPPGTGVIVVVNHISQIDTVLMARLIWQSGRIPRFLIKSSVFATPVLGKMMAGAGQIPVHRGTTDAAKSLQDAVAAIKRGECVIIYPEGTTSRDPDKWPMQGKTGVGRLILLTPDTPVVPIGQWGAHRRKGWRRFIPARRVASASVGEPLDMSRYAGSPSTKLREITDVVMSAVRDQVAQLREEPAPTTFFVPAKGSTPRG